MVALAASRAIQIEIDRDTLVVRARGQLGDDAVDDRGEVDGPPLDAQLAHHDVRGIHEVVDEAAQQAAVALDDVERARGLGGVGAVMEELQPRHHRRERRAQLVREDGEHVVLPARDGGQLVAEAGLGDGERGHPRQRLGQRDVGLGKAAARAGRDQRQGAERARVGADRHRDVAGHAQLADQPLELGVPPRHQLRRILDVHGDLALAGP